MRRLGRPFAFLEHNQQRVTNVWSWRTDPPPDLLISDETLAGFYRSGFQTCTTFRPRSPDHGKKGDGFLHMARMT